jgi:serpin B
MKKWFIQPRAVVAGAAVMCAAFSGCSRDLNPDGTKNYPQVPEIHNPLVGGYNALGFRLFQQLNGSGKDKNILISPLSIATVLAMTHHGARGATQSEMSNALGITALSNDEVNNASSTLQSSLNAPGAQITLTTANSLWARQGTELEKPFLDTSQRFFGAQIQSLDSADPQAVGTINGWVNTHTQGKISEIIERLDPSSRLVLVNAVYFKGQWQTKFASSSTRDAPFRLSAKNSKPVPLMGQKGDFQYLEDTSATNPLQAVSLPYGNGRLSLYLFMPGKKSSLATLTKQLTAENWNRWMSRFVEREGIVSLPRFKMEYEAELISPLKANGLKLMFDAKRADFSGISTKEPLYVSEVRHKTIIEVNEEGTEAAAATAAVMNATGASSNEPFEFIADRPFLAALRDNATGIILFLGAVRDPQ